MKLAPCVALLGIFAALAACTTTTTNQGGADPGAAGADAGAGAGEELDPDDPANQPPHSLGTIMLGESHASGSGTPSPIVSVGFVPDARKARACKKKLDAACEIAVRVKCTENKDSFTGCDEGEACVLDDACAPACKKIAVCSKECDEEESCTLDKSGKAVCAKIESFDAGPIAFSGTTTSITMFPPYAYENNGNTGAPFLANAEIKVQAQGAVDAGFEAFDESFKATTFLQTSPALNKIPREKVFGTGALPIAWKAGADAIVITVAGPGGAVTCKAKDAEGKFDVPRSAIEAALGDEEENAGPRSLSLSVSRQRKETRKGFTAKGELSQVKVEPEGWLDLVTLSTESTSVQGCRASETACGSGNECANLQTDRNNCGSCGKSCGSGMACGGGKCVDPAAACDACAKSAETGACKTSFNACKADAACSALNTCVGACTSQQCVQDCVSQNEGGVDKLNAFITCARNACSAVCN
ncbi:MAG: hypothetical protein KF795_04655 [Labilithrix sp.]|nr:hypothetical protein [Labilithrix sp.]